MWPSAAGLGGGDAAGAADVVAVVTGVDPPDTAAVVAVVDAVDPIDVVAVEACVDAAEVVPATTGTDVVDAAAAADEASAPGDGAGEGLWACSTEHTHRTATRTPTLRNDFMRSS